MLDKVWIHKDTEHGIVDIVSAYQEFAQEIKLEGIENFVEYVNKENLIEKACEWLLNHNNYQRVLDNGCSVRFDMTQCVIDFRKAMELWQNIES